MAYFPNGSSGVVLDEQCAECLPYDPCPIAWVQLEYNYTQCADGQEKMRELMNCLVDKHGRCKMKEYVKPRLTERKTEEERRAALDDPALKRRLAFGDEEQIAAIQKIEQL